MRLRLIVFAGYIVLLIEAHPPISQRGFGGSQNDSSGWLREDDFRIFPVPGLDLAVALESKDHRTLRLWILGDDSVRFGNRRKLTS